MWIAKTSAQVTVRDNRYYTRMRRTIRAPFRLPLVLALVLILALALTASCGGPATGVRSPGGDDAATLKRFPALRYAPERPTYALVSVRASDLVSAAREFLTAVGLLADGDMGELDRDSAKQLGFNPFAVDTLTAAGIDANGSAVIFSTGFLPTFVMPIADSDKLDAFLELRMPKRGVKVRQYKERDWHSYVIDAPLSVQWIRWDGYLAVRLSVEKKVESVAWLDELFDEDQSLAGSASMHEALRAIDERVSSAKVAGLIDVADIFRDVLEQLPDDEAKKMAGCVELFSPLSGAIAIGAHLDWGAASGVLKIGLTKSAARALREHITRPPPGYAGVRDKAGLYASIGVDPVWLDKRRKAVGCPLWDRPLVGKKGTFRWLPGSLSAAFAAVLDLRPSDAVIRAAGYIGFRDDALARALLGMIPQRRFLERKSTIADQPVRVIQLPLAPKVIYQRKDDSLLVTVGDAVMTEILDPPEDASSEAGLDVLSLAIYPSRLPELQDILVTAARYMQISEHFAVKSYRRLRRYDHGRVHVTLEGDELIIRLSMRLARM